MTKIKVKIGKKKKMTVGKKTKAKSRPQKQFGAVTSIQTAPVAIGNSIKGAQSQVVQSKSGVIVKSRDFMFSAKGSGAVQTWTMVGGTPITPAVFVDSTLRNYMQMYQKYRWKSLAVHYITSSPTTANGDIMFYHQKNRESVFLNQTSTQLLPFVLNDDDTVIGPQWTNHSVQLHITGKWKSTDYGMTPELEMYADGDVFLLSKTSTIDSPGYVLFDYEVEFQELQISPRLLSLPLPRAQWHQTNFNVFGTLTTNSTNNFYWNATGNDISGTASTAPPGAANGDIYKVIIDLTNAAAMTNVTATTLFRVPEVNGFNTVSVQDGTTLYAVYNGANFIFYPNAVSAFTMAGPLVSGVSNAAVVANLQVWLSLIGTVGNTNFNPNF